MTRNIAATASILLLAGALSACGGSAASTDQDTAADIAPAYKYGGPEGTLEADGLGEAKQGMSGDEVIALFGPPETRETVPGCELDTSAHKLISFIYETKGGTAHFLFDEPSGALQSYDTDDPGFKTAEGIGVGMRYDQLAKAYGDELKPYDLGAKATPEDGVWYVEKAAKSWLDFDILKGKINQIMGGYLPACE
jgi:hypothetical protein